METLHASCIGIGDRAVLIEGRSGAGKSDLTLRLIDRGAELVSDDYTHVRRDGARLYASAPERIAGRIEVRGLGIIDMVHRDGLPVALVIGLEDVVERMPEDVGTRHIAGITVPLVRLAALEASAPIKVELALARHGLAA